MTKIEINVHGPEGIRERACFAVSEEVANETAAKLRTGELQKQFVTPAKPKKTKTANE